MHPKHMVLNFLLDFQLAHMATSRHLVFILGKISALLVKPVAADLWVDDEDLPQALPSTTAAAPKSAWGLRLAAWSTVLIPLAWGGWFTVQKAVVLLAQ